MNEQEFAEKINYESGFTRKDSEILVDKLVILDIFDNGVKMYNGMGINGLLAYLRIEEAANRLSIIDASKEIEVLKNKYRTKRMKEEHNR